MYNNSLLTVVWAMILHTFWCPGRSHNSGLPYIIRIWVLGPLGSGSIGKLLFIQPGSSHLKTLARRCDEDHSVARDTLEPRRLKASSVVQPSRGLAAQIEDALQRNTARHATVP